MDYKYQHMFQRGDRVKLTSDIRVNESEHNFCTLLKGERFVIDNGSYGLMSHRGKLELVGVPKYSLKNINDPDMYVHQVPEYCLEILL